MSKRENLGGDMTARHACALLILGWYLIVPPMVERDGGLRPNPRAPLTDWQHIDTYVSAEACRSGIVDHLRTVEAAEQPAVVLQSQLAGCIASHDSRLKIVTRRRREHRHIQDIKALQEHSCHQGQSKT